MAFLLELRLFRVAYDSLIILEIESAESAKRLVHSLYLSNIDTIIFNGEKHISELDLHGFIRAMNETKGVKRSDEIRLYHLLCKINNNINMFCITEQQRRHVKRLRQIIYDMETRHYALYGREIYEELRPVPRFCGQLDAYGVHR